MNVPEECMNGNVVPAYKKVTRLCEMIETIENEYDCEEITAAIVVTMSEMLEALDVLAREVHYVDIR